MALLLFLAWGCTKDDEQGLTPPRIEVLETTPGVSSAEVCGAISHQVLAIDVDGTLELTVRFTGDVALGSAKFDLHQNFDCHGHKSMVWNHIDIVELSGTEQTLTKTFTPPEDVRPGLYHLGIMCIDEVGQEAPFVFYDLMVRDLSDTIPPAITVDTPGEGASHDRSQPLVTSGQLEDNMELGTGGLEISFIDSQGLELSVARIGFPEETGQEASFYEEYVIPSFAASGVCSLKYAATDWRNNLSITYRSLMLED